MPMSSSSSSSLNFYDISNILLRCSLQSVSWLSSLQNQMTRPLFCTTTGQANICCLGGVYTATFDYHSDKPKWSPGSSGPCRTLSFALFRDPDFPQIRPGCLCICLLRKLVWKARQEREPRSSLGGGLTAKQIISVSAGWSYMATFYYHSDKLKWTPACLAISVLRRLDWKEKQERRCCSSLGGGLMGGWDQLMHLRWLLASS
ncbi:uncharacterized protein ACIGJ3_003398 isoform 1-T1 [Trichechus inunguis]